MPKYRYLLLFIVVLAVLITTGVILNQSQGKVIPTTSQQVEDTSSQNPDQFSYRCENGKTAFDVLNSQTQVEVSESSFGKLVTSINGKSQSDGKYWLYSVDGKEATVAATSYNCVGGEQVVWELK